jgi:hypothetical protein
MGYGGTSRIYGICGKEPFQPQSGPNVGLAATFRREWTQMDNPDFLEKFTKVVKPGRKLEKLKRKLLCCKRKENELPENPKCHFSRTDPFKD